MMIMIMIIIIILYNIKVEAQHWYQHKSEWLVQNELAFFL